MRSTSPRTGINIVSAEEELRADAARKDDCRRLKLAPGAPLPAHRPRGDLARGPACRMAREPLHTTHFVYAVTLS